MPQSLSEIIEIEIQITEQDIAQGRPGCADGCPLFLALKRATGWPGSVALDAWWPTGYHPSPGARRYFPLPDAALMFMNLFDYGEPTRPFRFVVFLPKEFLKEKRKEDM